MGHISRRTSRYTFIEMSELTWETLITLQKRNIFVVRFKESEAGRIDGIDALSVKIFRIDKLSWNCAIV